MKSWQRIQELFEETVGLDVEQRSRLLAERTNGDAELVRRVEALIAADETPLTALDRTATDLLQELAVEPPAEELCGTTSGPYRIEEHLSTGGMGQVYRATRTSAGTERRVALKVLRPGLDTEAFLERFQRERETLAALEHEHIVAFLDAGALPDGRPYLVMEYVDGLALTEWGRGAPLRERLERFLQVLAAVQYAHQKLVVHRDLKPANVLITAQGTPKLLDFGVASVLEEESQASERAPLTPAYASPEELRGEPATTASDVYSLGVLLRELTEAEDEDGDLGAIVKKACAPESAQRYASADRLADDLRRFLACEPISARPTTWSGRASLFVRRNRWPVALAAAVVLSLTAGWVGADLDRRAAETNAGLGWGAHAEAKRAANVFEGWIAAVTARDAALGADAAAYLEGAIQGELDACPETETVVRMALADLYLQRGDHERAAAHAERANELARTTIGIGRREKQRAVELLDRAQAGG